MDCQKIVFSNKQSQKRIEKALRVFPSQVLKKILFFVLYLLGARLSAISSLVELPKESGKTTIARVMRDGLFAFRDRRQSEKTNISQLSVAPQKQQVSVTIEENYCTITFGNVEHQLKIPLSHQIHLRSVLLSLLQADLLTLKTVAPILNVTIAHCRELSARLTNEDIPEVLIDKRKGQKSDFCVDLSVKSELIQHFAARAVTGHSISSQALTKIINDKKQTNISPRTIRWHMNKMGLMNIKKTLPELVEALKKNF